MKTMKIYETNVLTYKEMRWTATTSEVRIWALKTTHEAKKPVIFYHAALKRNREVAKERLKGSKDI